MRTEKEYKELTVKEFTKAADVYESGHAGIYEMCRDDYPFVAEELEKTECRDLLDCGCGTGPMISLLHEKDPDRHYVGLDLTPRMIEVARAKNLSNTEFVVGDAEKMPFADESFDVIICTNSFHHYPDPQSFFDSVHRVLRKGGRLILQDYTGPGFLVKLMNRIEMPLLNMLGRGDVAGYTLGEVRVFCEKAGLEVRDLKKAKKLRMHLVAIKTE